MIGVYYASLTSQEIVEHRVTYPDGNPSRYQPRAIGLNFSEKTGTGCFPFGDSREITLFVQTNKQACGQKFQSM